MAALQGVPPRKACQGYKRPQAPPDQKEKKKKKKKKRDFPGSCSILGHFLHACSLLQTHFYTQKHPKKQIKAS